MRVLEVVGSDVERHSCPYCGCHDRERHLLLYLDKLKPSLTFQGARILHFAPESALSRLIRQSSPAHYTQADLLPDRPEIASIDICHMPFPDRSFDVVIANHVLEHVDSDTGALREIVRVLRPGGQALLQTPFSALLTRTLEDPGVFSAVARRALFGQEDHVRLYGRDFEQRAMQAGLVPCGHSHEALLPDIDPRRYGVNPREPLMLFRKAG
jgi:SAM-dependent methyltransferase